MRMTPLAILFAAGLASCNAPVNNPMPEGMEMPPAAQPTDHHVWLQQLVGDWNVSTEAVMGPGQEPMKMQYVERVRPIGELWIQAESTAKFGGQPFTSLMTLGYDPAQGAYVGTWVDTMQTHLWKYRGTLDASGKVLTLVSEGPAFEDPQRMVEFHDVIEMKDKNHKVMSSQMQGEDGQWTTFMTADFRRKGSR